MIWSGLECDRNMIIEILVHTVLNRMPISVAGSSDSCYYIVLGTVCYALCIGFVFVLDVCLRYWPVAMPDQWVKKHARPDLINDVENATFCTDALYFYTYFFQPHQAKH